MKRFFRGIGIVLMFICSASLWAQVASSSGSVEELMTVVATGYGRTTKEAEKDALRAAVQRAVGVFVASSVLTQNEELINDQILTASNGIVQSYVSSTPTMNSAIGLYQVNITALVLKKVLLSKLEENRIAYSTTVAGQNLFARAVSIQNKMTDASAIFDATWEDVYVTNADKLFKIRLIDPSGGTGSSFVPQVDPQKDGSVNVNFFVEFAVDLDYWYGIVVPKWTFIMDAIADKRLPEIRTQATSDPNRRSFAFSDDDPQRQSSKWMLAGNYYLMGKEDINWARENYLDNSSNRIILSLVNSQDKAASIYSSIGWEVSSLRDNKKAGMKEVIFDKYYVNFLDKNNSKIRKINLVNSQMQDYIINSNGSLMSFATYGYHIIIRPFSPLFYFHNPMQFKLMYLSVPFGLDALAEVDRISVGYEK